MLSLSALSDPTRRRIVELLAKEEYTAGEIVQEFNLTAPAISQHLKVLRDAGLIRVRAEAQRRVYAVNPRGFEELDAWLHRMHGFWSERLDDLEAALREESAPIRKPAKRVRSKSAPNLPSKPTPAPATDAVQEIIKMETP